MARLLFLLGLLSLLSFYSSSTNAVKIADFKTCAQSSFCRRARSLSDRHDKHNFSSPYHVSPSPSWDSSHATLTLPISHALYPSITFEVVVKVLFGGVVRVRMDEVGPGEGTGRKRYDGAGQWALVDGHAFAPLAGVEHTTAAGFSQLSWSDATKGVKSEVVIRHDPLRVAFLRGGEEQVVFNDDALLRMEHFRKKKEAEPLLVQEGSGEGGVGQGTSGTGGAGTDAGTVLAGQERYEGYESKDEGEDGWWEEDFNGTTDRKPKGPESLSLDILFPSYQHIYGLPEHASSLALRPTRGSSSLSPLTSAPTPHDDPYRLYNLDVFEYLADSSMGLYGAIPLLHAQKASSTVGVFFLNAAETWVDVTYPPSHSSKSVRTHWASESGILDAFVLLGPTPQDVSRQYAGLTGTTAMPPGFAIGHHQCRWNYQNEEDVKDVVRRFDERDLPVDVVWLDIEYAEEHKYFVWDKRYFPNPIEMQNFLASRGRKLVVIVDPHIKRVSTFDIYTSAQKLDILSKTHAGEEYEGWCWTGSSVWVDFFNPKSWDWWTKLFDFKTFEGSTEVLHIWNDMNEPAIFNGPETTMPKDNLVYGGWEHRDVHNANGMTYQNATYQAMLARQTPSKRPFVLSRSFFAGSQRVGAIWTGDNMGTWAHLAGSVPMLLSLNIAGMSYSGADVGGFFGNPSEEMLVRWYQAGAFEPFFRAHAHLDTKRREPYLFEEPTFGRIRDMLRLRYSLLSSWYTAFWEAQFEGLPIIRPNYYVFPDDVKGFAIDDQYYVGSTGLLVRPVVDEKATSASLYLSDKTPYYHYFTNGAYLGGQRRVTISGNMDELPLLQRGGHILTRRDLIRRSAPLMSKDPITLVVALDSDSRSATGQVYLDDEESFDFQKGDFLWRTITASRFENGDGVVITSRDRARSRLKADNLPSAELRKLKGKYNPERNGFVKAANPIRVETVVVLGLEKKPTCIRAGNGGRNADNKPLDFEWEEGASAIAIAGGKTKDGAKASKLTVYRTSLSILRTWELEISVDPADACKKPTDVVRDPISALQSSLCPSHGHFRCENKGHVPGCILVSRVNDGICDEECCDGSDETDGKVKCPNKCAEVGAEFRKKGEAEEKKRRAGAKIRREWSRWGLKEKERLDEMVVKTAKEIVKLQKEEAQAKKLVTELESSNAGEGERRRASQLYTRVEELKRALKLLRSQRTALEKEVDELVAILKGIKSGYNPNYQDMPVKHGVQAFDAFRKQHKLLDPDEVVDTGEENADESSDDDIAVPPPDEFDDDQLTAFESEDVLQLIAGYDAGSGIKTSVANIFDIQAYLPDALRPAFTSARANLVDLLIRTGIVSESARAAPTAVGHDSSPELNNAKAELTTVEGTLKAAETRLEQDKEALKKDWGPQWEWKKLDGTCVKKDVGEYTYELCFFGAASQKQINGYSSTNLGHFTTWNSDAGVSKKSPQYYTKQLYDDGERCWNGPVRKVKASLICGLTNELLSVAEPEKCEYLFTIQTPAACADVEGEGSAGKTEL